MIFLTVVVVLLCVLAIVLEGACMREPSIPDSELSIIGRRILLGGLVVIVLRLTWIVVEGQSIHIVGLLGIGMVVFGNVIRCANRLAMIERQLGESGEPPMFLRKPVDGG